MSSLGTGLYAGLVVGVPFGPVGGLALRHAVKGAFPQVWALALGTVMAEAAVSVSVALVASLPLAAAVSKHASLRYAFAAFLVLVGVKMIVLPIAQASSAPAGWVLGWAQGAGLTLLNPGVMAGYLSILLVRGQPVAHFSSLAGLSAGVLLSSGGWWLIFIPVLRRLVAIDRLGWTTSIIRGLGIIFMLSGLLVGLGTFSQGIGREAKPPNRGLVGIVHALFGRDGPADAQSHGRVLSLDHLGRQQRGPQRRVHEPCKVEECAVLPREEDGDHRGAAQADQGGDAGVPRRVRYALPDAQVRNHPGGKCHQGPAFPKPAYRRLHRRDVGAGGVGAIIRVHRDDPRAKLGNAGEKAIAHDAHVRSCLGQNVAQDQTVHCSEGMVGDDDQRSLLGQRGWVRAAHDVVDGQRAQDGGKEGVSFLRCG